MRSTAFLIAFSLLASPAAVARAPIGDLASVADLVSECSQMLVIAAITEPVVITKILTHLGLPMLSRPASRPRAPPLFAEL